MTPREPRSKFPARAGLFGKLAVVLVLLLVGVVVGDFNLVRFTSWAIFGLLALSLDWVWGQGGIFSFGQTAFFGVAGYAYGVIAVNAYSKTGETASALLGAILVAALFSALLGYFIFYGRVSEVYLAIITLAVTLVLLTFFASTADSRYAVGQAKLGGYNGMSGIPPLTLGIPYLGSEQLSIRSMYFFMVLVAVGVYLLLRLLVRSPFGRILAAVRENELRTELLGYDVRRYKLLAFILGGAIAGLAGASYAAWALFINPAVFTLAQAALVVIWVLVGGRGTLKGAFLGVIVVEGLSTTLGGMTSQTTLILGLVLIVIVLFAPNGLLALWDRATARFSPPASVGRRRSRSAPLSPLGEAVEEREYAPAGSSAVLTAEGSVLETSQLGISFGGVQAVRGVSLEFGRGLHCLIGPNGAGKSTFFHLLVGRYRPKTGRIIYGGRDITRLAPFRRAQLGMGIKLQVASIYGPLSVSENLWLASYAGSHHVARAEEREASLLSLVGLETRRHLRADELSHGEQQWLEMAMVLAADPKLVLLDEPTSGMTREETQRTAELVLRMAETHTLLVVEHDMEFVRAVGAPVTVFHDGAVFRQGTLADLRNDDEVLNIYLGKRGHAGD